MKKGISSIKEIKNAVDNSIVIKMMESLAEEVYKRWYESLKEGWYDKYTPIYYERQFGILKSLIKTDIKSVGKYMQISVYIDEVEMGKYHPNSQGDASPETIINIIENEGMTLTNGVERTPAKAYEETLAWLLSDYKKFLTLIVKTDKNMTIT